MTAQLEGAKVLSDQRIAVVDDDEGSRSSMVALLRSFGCAAQGYDCADACLAEAMRWDCVISDINMPGTNGHQLLAALQRRDKPSPVILMTAYSTSDARRKARDAGALCFFEKPVDDLLLLVCLTEILGEVP